jgi:hypothetical protein
MFVSPLLETTEELQDHLLAAWSSGHLTCKSVFIR